MTTHRSTGRACSVWRLAAALGPKDTEVADLIDRTPRLPNGVRELVSVSERVVRLSQPDAPRQIAPTDAEVVRGTPFGVHVVGAKISD